MIRSVYILERINRTQDTEIRGVAVQSDALIPEIEALADQNDGEIIYGHWGRNGQRIEVWDGDGGVVGVFNLSIYDLL